MGKLDIDLTWPKNDEQQDDGLRRALVDQLGLELVSSREPVEMRVVEWSK